MIEEIVGCTNMYITAVQSNYDRKRDAKITTKTELMAFLGLLVLSGVKRAGHVSFLELWATDGQVRSQDLEKGGAILKEWEVCKRPWSEFSLLLNQFHTVCTKIETKFLGNLGNSKVFPPKIKWSPKKKKKKRSSPILRLIVRPNSEIQTFEGGYFQFFTKNRPQNHQKGAILHTSQANGGLEPPPPPWLRCCRW